MHPGTARRPRRRCASATEPCPTRHARRGRDRGLVGDRGRARPGAARSGVADGRSVTPRRPTPTSTRNATWATVPRVEALAARVLARHARIDLLVNNAGFTARTEFAGGDPARHRGDDAGQLPRLGVDCERVPARPRPRLAHREHRVDRRRGSRRPVLGLQARAARVLALARRRARAARDRRAHRQARPRSRRPASPTAIAAGSRHGWRSSRPSSSSGSSARSSTTGARSRYPAGTARSRSSRRSCRRPSRGYARPSTGRRTWTSRAWTQRGSSTAPEISWWSARPSTTSCSGSPLACNRTRCSSGTTRISRSSRRTRRSWQPPCGRRRTG